MKKFLYVIASIFLLISCGEYKGSLYLIEIQYTDESYGIVDTVIAGFPKKGKQDSYLLITEDQQYFRNVSSARVIKKIRYEYSEKEIKYEHINAKDKDKWFWQK